MPLGQALHITHGVSSISPYLRAGPIPMTLFTEEEPDVQRGTYHLQPVNSRAGIPAQLSAAGSSAVQSKLLDKRLDQHPVAL